MLVQSLKDLLGKTFWIYAKCVTMLPNSDLARRHLLRMMKWRLTLRKRSKLVDTLSSGSYNSHFKGEGKYAWLTKDKSIQEKYAADPKCTFKFTLNGYDGLFSIEKARKLLGYEPAYDWKQGTVEYTNDDYKKA